MDDPRVTTQDLLVAWRDATRAAELAERLAEIASEAADQADERALASVEISEQAEQAATASKRAYDRAQAAADKAHTLATKLRGEDLEGAGRSVEETRAAAEIAQDAYHGAEGRPNAG